MKKEEKVEAEFIQVCRWLSQPFSYENPYEDWLLGRIPFELVCSKEKPKPSYLSQLEEEK